MARSPAGMQSWPAGIPRRAALALGAGLAVPALSRAQPRFPDRPIRLVVPFGAGGNLDTLARMLIPGVSERLGQPIVIENRAGAGGNIGTEVVARAAPDGYTLLLGSNGALTINPLIMERVPYDPAKDFAPVCLCFRTPQVLVISPKLPVRTLAEFVAYAKARPGQLQCGSAGSGTSNHLNIELLNAATGIGLVHVPYRASGAATPDLLNGALASSMEQITTALPLHRDGQLPIIAAALPQPLPLLPGIPTLAEAGVPGGGLVSFIGILVPSGTPGRIVATLAGGLRRGAGRTRVAREDRGDRQPDGRCGDDDAGGLRRAAAAGSGTVAPRRRRGRHAGT